ncbi:MFS transporter [Massilia psychrophila]|uniref:MFS transporter n=2 Tax=Massilia psychrophila TaxID=1603353 RepID=A0A2G8SY04_9BURK|nr:MFS transporter [Massilia psychrophila]GGE69297.1 MFS transporter [Massilia psychrophila]
MHDPRAARAALLRDTNFRWMMVGGAISMLGDQFTLIALPWLVLQLTGDALTLGLTIALMGVPRAIFILVGGALVDRYSPKRVLMLTKYANAFLLGLLAALVLTHQVTMPLVYALALGIGLASAFSIPSGSSMLPNVVAPHQLQMANGMMMSMRVLTALAGPLLAGLLIAFSSHDPAPAGGAGMTDARGLGIAFALDAVSFAVTVWTLHQVQMHPGAVRAAPQRVLAAVGDGLAMVWRDVEMRSAFIYWGVMSFVVGGAMQVAMPLLASSRLGGVAALGLVMGAHAAGNLAGMGLSSLKGDFRIGTFGTTLLLLDAVAGVVLMCMGSVGAAWQAAALMLLLGLLSGFTQVAVFTWIQRRVAREMLGRTMSIFMFILMGLAPLAASLTGLSMQYLDLTQLFVGAGLFLLAGTLAAFALTPMRVMNDSKSATISALTPDA